MDADLNPIDLPKLKDLIRQGIQAIPVDHQNNQAVLVIGDTGVGKSTILSFLSGSNLVVKFDGLKPTLDNMNDSLIKIGHDKYSETSIPTKISIEKMAFYDCPGFKDNKGQQYEISNSFFIQRLLDIYHKVKIVLIVDQSHISQARADKLPKLVRNLHASFETFEDIKDGCSLIVNRAGKENSIEDYHSELKKTIYLKNQNGFLFEEEERKFLQYIMKKNRLLVFRQANKEQRNQIFSPSSYQANILSTIKESSYVKSKHIHNILSESAKLAIRDFIDEITNRSNYKVELICVHIVDLYWKKVQDLGSDALAVITLKEEVIGLAEEVKVSQKENIINILQRELSPDQLQNFEEDFASVMFFKNIYDKTKVYFDNLVSKIYSQLSHLLTKLDKRITIIQRENEEEKRRQLELLEKKRREEEKQREKIEAMQHCSKMEELKMTSKAITQAKKNLLEEIKSALKCLGSVEQELKRVKEDAIALQSLNKSIEEDFMRIQTNYFQKKSVI